MPGHGAVGCREQHACFIYGTCINEYLQSVTVPFYLHKVLKGQGMDIFTLVILSSLVFCVLYW